MGITIGLLILGVLPPVQARTISIEVLHVPTGLYSMDFYQQIRSTFSGGFVNSQNGLFVRVKPDRWEQYNRTLQSERPAQSLFSDTIVTTRQGVIEQSISLPADETKLNLFLQVKEVNNTSEVSGTLRLNQTETIPLPLGPERTESYSVEQTFSYTLQETIYSGEGFILAHPLISQYGLDGPFDQILFAFQPVD